MIVLVLVLVAIILDYGKENNDKDNNRAEGKSVFYCLSF